MGLLGDFAIGAVAGAAKSGADITYAKIQSDIEEAKAARLKEMEERIQMAREERAIESAKELKTWELDEAEGRKKKSARELETATEGLLSGKYAEQINEKFGSQVGAEEARSLIGNQQAREAYGIEDLDEIGMARLQEQAAMKVGDTAAASAARQSANESERLRNEKARLALSESAEARQAGKDAFVMSAAKQTEEDKKALNKALSKYAAIANNPPKPGQDSTGYTETLNLIAKRIIELGGTPPEADPGKETVHEIMDSRGNTQLKATMMQGGKVTGVRTLEESKTLADQAKGRRVDIPDGTHRLKDGSVVTVKNGIAL